MLTIQQFEFNPFQVNTYLIIDEAKNCIIVDPACYFPEEYDTLFEYISSNNLQPVKIMNTHCHIDHILGCSKVKEKYKIEFYAHEADQFLVTGMHAYAAMYNFDVEEELKINHFIKAESIVHLGNNEIHMLHVPGHSPGSICMYSPESKFVITGDVLFKGSIGRSDLPGGNHNLLIEGIKKKLFTLPGEVIVYPGHSYSSTIDLEKRTNPFFRN